jgi:hypothetical protein
MKPLLLSFIFLDFFNIIDGQGNVGINTDTPSHKLHIVSNNEGILALDNNSSATLGLTAAMYFGNNISAQGPGFKYTGAVKTILTSGSEARMGLYTYASNTPAGLQEHVTILDDGSVGINTVTPTYKLDVNGTFHASQVANLSSDVNIGGILNSKNINTTGNISVSQNVTVNGGLGLVAFGNGNRQKLLTYTATLSVSNLAAGTLLGASGTIGIPAGTFSGTPAACLGNVITPNGDYYKATIILENVTATNVTIRIFNGTSGPITFSNAAWKVLVYGPY